MGPLTARKETYTVGFHVSLEPRMPAPRYSTLPSGTTLPSGNMQSLDANPLPLTTLEDSAANPSNLGGPSLLGKHGPSGIPLP